MALRKNVYRILEDIVGQQNISDEPVILDTYAFQWLAETISGTKFCSRPEAVLLPCNVEEVQAIIKACNRYGIRYKAFSTGWGPWNTVGGEGVIQLDLRRMNSIVEIDEKNMYAVVEPYVIGSQLQVEAMKKGLNCHMVGAGANCSILASATSMAGYGLTGIFMGYSNSNVLAVEWVLPDGEILRLGSLGSGDGWFCGDGPGPSLRGIMRGMIGALGGLGVFTKCGVKLYPWYGPPTTPMEGIHPLNGMPIPENYQAHSLTFPSWEALSDAVYRIGEAEIGYVMGRALPPGLIPVISISSAADYTQMLQMVTMDEFKYAIQIILGANSARELEYQKRAVEDILSETGGKIIQMMEEPSVKNILFRHLIKSEGISRVFQLAGTFATSLGAGTSWDTAVATGKIGEQLKRKYIERGAIADDGGDLAWGGTYQQGRFGHLEEIIMYDFQDADSLKGADEYVEESAQAAIDKSLGQPISIVRGMAEQFGPSSCDYHIWMKKIKKAFDPNTTSDPSFYIEPEA
ncbi:MAG: FAD-binding oxidoreductase [Dehalococcoidia bacterium]|nr:FAD-binding oxidoreductase [Dehalococcoidia bacterium]